MKPWEQKWCQKMRNPWSIRDEATGDERAHVFTDNQTPAEADAVATFLAAAPDMARALMAIRGRMLEMGWNHGAEMDDVEAALRKAGVL